jgi:hypothetical protein
VKRDPWHARWATVPTRLIPMPSLPILRDKVLARLSEHRSQRRLAGPEDITDVDALVCWSGKSLRHSAIVEDSIGLTLCIQAV